jgi:hypothetical protein
MLHGRPGLQLLFRAVAAKGQLLLWAAPVQQPGARSQEPGARSQRKYTSPERSAAGATKAGG